MMKKLKNVKRHHLLLLIFTVILFGIGKSFGQGIIVSGKVSDSSGQPLPNVTVTIKGATAGTTSDDEGLFRLDVPADATLVFSSVGMVQQEVEVKGQTTLNVVLEGQLVSMDSVVVIGYGTARKKDLTGSVGLVSGEVIAAKQTPQLSQALQGALSGVMVTRTSGFASESASVRIRGITTINNSTPLIVVDGIPGSLDNVNPGDVDQVTVLKDGASAAIYGSRAASGVILITTKRGKSGVSLNYTASLGIETPTALPQGETAVEYMRMYNEMAWNDNKNAPGNEFSTYAEDLISNYASLHAENPDAYPDVDWMDVMLNRSAPRHSHVLGLNAGSEKVATRVSLAYDNFDAIYDNRNFERITIRANNDITITDKLSATVDLNFIRTTDKRPIINFSYVNLRYPPIYAPIWSNGTYGPANTTGLNYYPLVRGDAGFDNNGVNTIGGRIALIYKPIPDLTLSATVSPTLMNDKRKRFVKRVPYYNADDPTTAVGYLQTANETSLTEGRSDNYQFTSQFVANYNKQFQSHRLNAILGGENFYLFQEDLTASRGQYEIDEFPYLDLGPLTYRDNGGGAYEQAYRSAFGRLIYSYADKYLVQVNGRYDGSSRFDQDYRWGFFPSVSVGWVASEEPFLENIQTISHFKMRASWGTLGNDRIGNYPYQSTIAFGSALFYRGSNLTPLQTGSISRYAIRDISWETTESYNIGLDVNFLQNRLTSSLEYYKKVTRDMLLELEVPTYLGFPNPDQNAGEMYTNGWDIDLGWKDRLGDLGYSVSVNIADFKSVIGDIGGTQFLGSKVKFEGSQFDEWYGYVSDGIYQTQAEVDQSVRLNATVAPGDIRYKDISGPNGVPDGVLSPEYDRVLLGGSLPRYQYGGNIQLDYKQFDFALTFQGVGKQRSYLTSSMVQPRFGLFKLIDGQQWSAYNTAEENQQAKYPQYRASLDNNYVTSDFWLFSGAYFRLKNVSLGYTLPESASRKMALKQARLYTSMTDLFSFNHYPVGYDPEGSDFLVTKSVNFGLSVTF